MKYIGFLLAGFDDEIIHPAVVEIFTAKVRVTGW